MRKTGAIIALAALLLVVPSSAGLAKRKLTLWNYNEVNWTVLCKQFMKENPDVEVKLLTSGSLDKLYTMIAGGLMPDVWGPWDTPGIKADVNRDWAISLDAFIKRDAKEINLDDFFPGMMRQFRVMGKQYSLPIFSYADYYFYNTSLYAQAGLNPPTTDGDDKSWNWDKMVQNAEKTAKYNSATGKITTPGLDITLQSQDPNWLRMWDANIYSEQALATSVPQQIYWTTPPVVNALTKVWELINKYHVANPTTGGFESKRVAASLNDGPNVNAYMRTKTLTWAIAPLPWAVTNSGTLWTDGWRIGKVCKDKELAWKFVKFLCRPDNMKYLVSDPKSMRFGTPPARRSVFNETLGHDIGKATGMNPADVTRVHEAMDASGILKRQESICIHMDMLPFWNPILAKLWQNKISPEMAAKNLQDITDRQLPILFKRWIRNIKFTGKEPKQ